MLNNTLSYYMHVHMYVSFKVNAALGLVRLFTCIIKCYAFTRMTVSFQIYYVILQYIQIYNIFQTYRQQKKTNRIESLKNAVLYSGKKTVHDENYISSLRIEGKQKCILLYLKLFVYKL